MSFSADIKIGETPLVVQFTDTSVGAVSWEWDFGDGSTSEEQSPQHTYYLEGAFTVIQTVTYSDLSQDTVTYPAFIISLPGITTPEEKCLRFSTEENEGQAWSEFDGTDFIRPMNNFGSFCITDDNQTDRMICFDRSDFRQYEHGTCDRIINDRAALVDKEQVQNSEIAWEKWEYETVFEITEEARFITHDRSYTNVRPEDKRRRGAVGYTASGLREAQRLTLEAYVDGEQISPAAQAEGYPESGEIVFSGITLKGNRVQMVHKGTASEIMVLNHVHYFLGSSEAKDTAKRTMAEHTLQLELATDLSVNIGRGYLPFLNKVTGVALTGTRVVGPDGKRSGFSCDTSTLDNAAIPSYTLVVWVLTGGGFSGVSDMVTMGIAGAWTMLYKRGSTLSAGIVLSAGAYAYVRIYRKYVSDDALTYIYNDVLKGGRVIC